MNAQFKKFTHIISDQFAAENEILNTCKQGNFSLESPFVQLNPYLIAPLTALVYFKTVTAEAATVTVKGKEKAGDITFTFPKATLHYLPIYGLYANYANTVEICIESGASITLTIQTEPTPEKVKHPTKIETTAEYFGKNLMFVGPTSAAMTAAYDYKGDVRWYCTLNLSFDTKRAKNGPLLVSANPLLMPPYHPSGIF